MYNSKAKAENGAWNKINFFNTASPKTKGLKLASTFKDGGMDSIGKIVFEKNNINPAKDIEAKTAVSCDLNK